MSGNSKNREVELSNENATFGRGKDERVAPTDNTATPAFGFPAVLADAISSAMNTPADPSAANYATSDSAGDLPVDSAGVASSEASLSNADPSANDRPQGREPLPDFGSAAAAASAGNSADSSGALSNNGFPPEGARPKKRGLFDRLAKNSRSSRASASRGASAEYYPAEAGQPVQAGSAASGGKNGNKQTSKQAAAKAGSNGAQGNGQGAGQQGKAKSGKKGASGQGSQGGQGAAGKKGGQPNQGDQPSMTDSVDFLWEPEEKRSAKGDPNSTTVVESDNDYLLLPHPDVFNAYPPEVQRKIMQWADRDVRARRDDESLRQDALVRARTARERTHVTVPVTIIVLCIICATITSCVTRSAIFPVSFLVVALAVIISIYFTRKNDLYAFSQRPDNDEEDEQ